MARRRAGGITTSLVFLCAVLGGVIYLQVNAELPLPPAPEVASGAAPSPQPQPPRSFSLGPRAEFAETIDRPLFMSTRRPPVPGLVEPEPDEEPPPAPPATLPGFALRGVVISPEERFALLQVAGAAELRKVNVGEQVDGWEVASIGPNRVVLKQGAVVHELTLKDEAAAPRSTRPSRTQGEAEDQPAEREPARRTPQAQPENVRVR